MSLDDVYRLLAGALLGVSMLALVAVAAVAANDDDRIAW